MHALPRFEGNWGWMVSARIEPRCVFPLAKLSAAFPTIQPFSAGYRPNSLFPRLAARRREWPRFQFFRNYTDHRRPGKNRWQAPVLILCRSLGDLIHLVAQV